MNPTIEVENLTVGIKKSGKTGLALQDVSFHVNPGEIVGLVGESGCGKSMTAMAIIRLLPKAAAIEGGRILFGRQDLSQYGERQMCGIRGKEISVIFQEPMSALNPLMTVGRQIEEACRIHQHCTKKEAYEKTLEIMHKAGLSRVESLYHEYPHRLSGGMKQRIVIAMALINRPKLLIADEPTTALDVTIQHQILGLIEEMAREAGSSVILVSHDLGVVHEVCSRVMVMYGGRIVEEGSAQDILKNPVHPYTRGLLASIPTPDKHGEKLFNIPGNIPPLNKRSIKGCGYASRCQLASDYCFSRAPEKTHTDNRYVLCHKNGGLLLEKQRTIA